MIDLADLGRGLAQLGDRRRRRLRHRDGLGGDLGRPRRRSWRSPGSRRPSPRRRSPPSARCGDTCSAAADDHAGLGRGLLAPTPRSAPTTPTAPPTTPPPHPPTTTADDHRRAALLGLVERRPPCGPISSRYVTIRSRGSGRRRPARRLTRLRRADDAASDERRDHGERDGAPTAPARRRGPPRSDRRRVAAGPVPRRWSARRMPLARAVMESCAPWPDGCRRRPTVDALELPPSRRCSAGHPCSAR